MASTIKIGTVQIRDEDYAIQGNAILGIRGAGKTTLAKSIAEQMLDLHIPIIALDPTGTWRHLRRGAKRGQNGFKVVVAGGEEPDLQLTPATAVEIVRAAITENIPLVIDLYDKKFSKADWRRIVKDTFRTLHYENKGVRHVFLEEAAEFAPQRVQDGETYAEVEKLMRMGGNQSIGVTLINQRSQEVNKAVLELCENLILMRQRGAHAIDAISKWVDKLSPSTAVELTNSLPTMEAGEAWVFRGDHSDPRRTRGNKLRSFHPDRRRPELVKSTARVDVTKFVTRLSEKLKDKSALHTVESLLAQVRELQKDKTVVMNQKGHTIANEKYDDLKRDYDELAEAVVSIRRANVELRKQLTEKITAFGRVKELVDRHVHPATEVIEIDIVKHPRTKNRIKLTPRGKANGGDGVGLSMMAHPDQRKATKAARDLVDSIAHSEAREVLTALKKGERRVLTVIAQHEAGVSEVQLAVETGYKETSRYTYLKHLRAKGCIVGIDPNISITQAGLAMLGDYERLPTGAALREYWLAKLPEGEKRVFSALVDQHPMPITDEELEHVCNYKETSIYTYLKKLRARKLIVSERKSNSVSEHLF